MAVTGAAVNSCLKDLKRFVQCHVFAQSSPDRRPSEKCPVNTLHRSRFA